MFLPLHVNTTYTLLQSPMSIKQYVKTAKQKGYTAIGMADVNVLYGVLEFYRECQKQEIKPLIGMTLQLPTDVVGQEIEEWIIYAKNDRGYQELVQLSTLIKTSQTVNRSAIYDFLFSHNSNWIVILGAVYGPHMAYLKTDQPVQAQAFLSKIRSKFSPDQLYIGISAYPYQRYHYDAIQKLSAQNKLPLIALPYIAYANREDHFVSKVVQAVGKNKKLEDFQLINEQPGLYYLRTAEEYQHMYAEAGLESILKISDEINQSIAPLHFESELILPKYDVPDGQTSSNYLRELAVKGLNSRIQEIDDRYEKRLNRELDVIHSMGFDDYFLIVWDVMAYARKQKITTGPGRGSAAGALVAFSLGITDVDPIENGLLFERFLNPERKSMPDIDLDFPDNKRDQIVHYVYRKYGSDHVAQISTFGTFQARQALRDVGNVLGKSQPELKKWTKTITSFRQTLREAKQQSRELSRYIASDKAGKLWFETALKIEGLPRHVSTHAAGVVISDSPLSKYIPLQNSISNDIHQSQWTKDDVEAIGLLKMDFLSLSNLTILHNVTTATEKLTHQAILPKQFRLDDQKVLQLFRNADTLGIFQFESDGIRNVLKRVSPTSIQDVAAVNALYRPGPMRQINHFVARKHHKEPIQYPHPSLEPILRETYGIMVYQEQVMQVAQQIAGFTLGEADILRRAMSKKKLDEMEKMADAFRVGAEKKGYSKEIADRIFTYIEEFADYGFNKSHAYAYSYLAYQLAWFKCYYPTTFYYANLVNTRIFDKKGGQLIVEAEHHHITIQVPNINTSFVEMQIQDEKTLQLGINDIKGISHSFAHEIVDERQKNGSYKSLYDFMTRITARYLKQEALVVLAKAGALDRLTYNRRTLIEEAIPKYITNIELFASNRNGQTSFNFQEGEQYPEMYSPNISDKEEYSARQLVEYEAETLGQAISVKLFAEFDPYYKNGILSRSDCVSSNQSVTMIGEIIRFKRITTKKGTLMAFLTLQDEGGEVEVTAFPEIFIQYASLLRMNERILVKGKTQYRNERIQLILEVAYPLNEKALTYLNKQTIPNKKRNYYIKVKNKKSATQNKAQLLALVKQFPGDAFIHFEMTQEEKQYWLSSHYNLSASPIVYERLVAIYGEGNVQYLQ